MAGEKKGDEDAEEFEKLEYGSEAEQNYLHRVKRQTEEIQKKFEVIQNAQFSKNIVLLCLFFLTTGFQIEAGVKLGTHARTPEDGIDAHACVLFVCFCVCLVSNACTQPDTPVQPRIRSPYPTRLHSTWCYCALHDCLLAGWGHGLGYCALHAISAWLGGWRTGWLADGRAGDRQSRLCFLRSGAR